MTKKRFDYMQGFGIYKIFETGKKNYDLGYAEDVREVVELLNNLSEENEQLRKKNAQLNERLRECYVRLDRNNCPKW